MRRPFAALLALLVLNTTLVQSVFACDLQRATLAQTDAPDAEADADADADGAAMHHAPATGDHHHAPTRPTGSTRCGFMLACAAVSAPATYVAQIASRPVAVAIVETRATEPTAPSPAPETPPPRL
jgi:hypothetical protein